MKAEIALLLLALVASAVLLRGEDTLPPSTPIPIDLQASLKKALTELTSAQEEVQKAQLQADRYLSEKIGAVKFVNRMMFEYCDGLEPKHTKEPKLDGTVCVAKVVSPESK